MLDPRRALLRLLSTPPLPRLFSPLMNGRAAVFMLHRLRDVEAGIEGNDASAIRSFLEYLRRRKYHLVSLERVFEGLRGTGAPLRRAVAFTLDDGYVDQGVPAAEIFAAFDCPSTTFVTTGFLDGQIWMWWDRIEFALRQTRRTRIEVLVGERRYGYAWADPVERLQCQLDLLERCKEVPDAEKHASIARLAAEAEVDLPEKPPPQYAPMSWDELRRAEHLGMRFAPHTVTHPVLSRVGPQQSRFELEESWKRLQAEARHPVPIWCYPNGQPGDFGSDEFETLAQLGFLGAVTGVAGYADRATLDEGPDGRFRVQRFSLPDDLPTAIQYASGLERLKELVRGLA